MTLLTARFAHPEEISAWDSLVTENPSGGDFLMTRAFAEAKQSVGWAARYVVFERGNADRPELRERASVALVLERRVPLLGKYWYLAKGPSTADAADLKRHLAALEQLVRREGLSVFAFTCEPALLDTPETRDELAASPTLADFGAHRTPGIQGNVHTAIVDLQRSDDELLASFDKKCRNMVRRAMRDGVEVRDYPADQQTFDEMYRLMHLVGGGKAKLALRSQAYLEIMWRSFAAAGQGRFYGIEVDGTPAVLAFTVRVGDRAFYKDGGSERPRTSPGMSNLLQFHMMREARDAGAKSYDMFGIAPADARSNDDHPAWALGEFKLGFSRTRTDYLGGVELVLRPVAYRLWQRIGKRVVSALHRRRYRDLDLY